MNPSAATYLQDRVGTFIIQLPSIVGAPYVLDIKSRGMLYIKAFSSPCVPHWGHLFFLQVLTDLHWVVIYWFIHLFKVPPPKRGFWCFVLPKQVCPHFADFGITHLIVATTTVH